MNVTILCSSKEHPITPYLKNWISKNSQHNKINLIHDLNQINYGDILFLISVTEIIKKEIRNKFRFCFVIHGSDLPHGKGWSPIVWQVLSGSNKIFVTLFEAADKLDTGDIVQKILFELEGHELYDEINEKLFQTELQLMDYALENINNLKSIPQPEIKTDYFRKRTPEDSELDPQKSIAEQFDLMRVADTNRYPTFFKYRNHHYELILRKF